ncbi:MAG TPA: HAD-IIIA family hydrolase [Chitinophagaceae bacterium]|nr:HAD-IIIA family hydrolase [Chitinophagaceae bacterium]
MIPFDAIDKSWTVFLDRDGVINRDKEGDYIRNAGEFVMLERVEEAIALLNDIFGYTIVVTNQKGVGRGLMTLEDLTGIHSLLAEKLAVQKAMVNKIYFCTATDNSHPNRKPQPGMAYLAKADFPGIALEKSIMAGNRLSDMEFGKNAGMYTVFIATTHPETPFPHPLIDERFNSLAEFAGRLALIKH